MLETIERTPCLECTERIRNVDAMLGIWREKMYEILSGLQSDLEGKTAMPLDIRERILDIRRNRLDLRLYIDDCGRSHNEHEALTRKQRTRLYCVDQMIEDCLEGIGDDSAVVLARLRFVKQAMNVWHKRIQSVDWPQYTTETVIRPLASYSIDKD